MPNVSFFKLTRDKELPLYVNAATIESIEFLGSKKDGYVAALTTNTNKMFLWGELRSIDVLLETPSFGDRIQKVIVISNTEIMPSKLFTSSVTPIDVFTDLNYEQTYFGFND